MPSFGSYLLGAAQLIVLAAGFGIAAHMPFSADIAQSHSTTGMHHVETVFVNWFYPQNSELLHAVGILMIGRDTLSLFINFGWLAVAFLAAYCVGRPYGRGIPAILAAA